MKRKRVGDMTGESMSVLREEISAQMRSRDTDELVKIWQEHDLSQWSELALDVVRQILQERLGELPASHPALAGEKAGERKKNPGKGFLWGWLIVNFAGWVLAVIYGMMFQDRDLMDVIRNLDYARFVPDRTGELIAILGIPLGISLACLQAIQVTRWKLPALPWLLIAGLTPVAAALLIGLPTSFVFERTYAAPEILPNKSPD